MDYWKPCAKDKCDQEQALIPGTTQFNKLQDINATIQAHNQKLFEKTSRWNSKGNKKEKKPDQIFKTELFLREEKVKGID